MIIKCARVHVFIVSMGSLTMSEQVVGPYGFKLIWNEVSTILLYSELDISDVG
jgi:hypothetical protein